MSTSLLIAHPYWLDAERLKPVKSIVWPNTVKSIAVAVAEPVGRDAQGPMHVKTGDAEALGTPKPISKAATIAHKNFRMAPSPLDESRV
ncbi:MAG: hypothetical protein WBG29_07715 [Candidatus Acidiferrales bacterium]